MWLKFQANIKRMLQQITQSNFLHSLCRFIVIFYSNIKINTFFFPKPKAEFFLIYLVLFVAVWRVSFGLYPSASALPQVQCLSEWRYEGLNVGTLCLPQSKRAPYIHGFFICGSLRINVLILPPQTGMWIRISFHHVSSTLSFSLTFPQSACPHETASPFANTSFFSSSSSSAWLHISVKPP